MAAKSIYTEIYDSLDDVVLTINSDYEVESMNKRGQEIFGEIDISKRKVKCYNLICNNTAPDKECQLHCLKKSGKKIKNKIIEKNNHFFMVKMIESPQESGETKYIDILHDVTELVQSEKHQLEISEEYQALNEEYHAIVEAMEEKNKIIHQEKEQYELLFSNMNAAFALHEIILDENNVPCDYRFLQCNSLFEEYTGLKNEEIIGKTLLETMPETEKFWIETYGKVALSGEPYNFTNFAKELNKYYEVRSYSPKMGQFAVTFHDVTNQINIQKKLEIKNVEYEKINNKLELNLDKTNEVVSKLEESLKQVEAKENLLQTVFNNTPSIMMLLNENTEILQINKTGIEITNKNEKEIIGLKGGDVFHCIENINNPNGCGSGEQCKYCKIRNTVENTLITGKDNYKIEAELFVFNDDSKQTKMDLLVSSTIIQVMGQKNVLVTIEDVSLLKQKEEKILESEEKYKALYNNAPLGYQSLDEDGNIIDVNPQWLEILGYSKEEVIGKKFSEFLIPEMIPIFKKRFPRFIAEGVLHNAYFKLCKKDGTLVDVSYEGCIGYTPEGNFKQTYCTFKDISDEKKAIEQLHLSEEKFRKAFYTSPDSVTITTLDGTFVDVNKGFTDIFGFNREEVINIKSPEAGIWTNPEQRDKLLESIIINGEIKNLETELRHKNGRKIITLLSANIIQFSNNPHILSINRDITKISIEKSYLKKAQEIGKIGTWHMDIMNNILSWTEENYKIFGIHLGASLTFQSFIDCVHPDDREYVLNEWNKAKLGMPYDIEHRLLVNGEIKWVREKADIQLNSRGNAMSALGVTQDITIKKQNEIELRKTKDQAEKADRLKSAFLANMSHEIRTPLNGIMGFSDIMANKKDLTEEQRVNYGNIIQQSSQHLLSIVNDILDISALENGTLEVSQVPVDLNKLLHEVYSIYSETIIDKNKNIKIKLNRLDENLVISSDGNRISQIINNLLNNAIKFTEQGTVEFGINTVTDKEITLYVQDTGIGIPKELHDEIFNRFRQAETTPNRVYGGNGLGLSIIKELLNLLDGEIWVESEFGHGACFYFTLPNKSVPNKTNNKQVKLPYQTSVSKLQILLVEDDAFNAMLIEEILIDTKVEITCALNGTSAIELAKNNQYDVILMDIRLPDMSGFDVVRKIREFNIKTPIIAQTAYAMQSDEIEAYKSGCTDYIRKPIDKETLLEKLSVIKY